MAHLKGIVFDLDGTLVNTEVNFRVMKQNMIAVLEDNGVPKGTLTPDETSVVVLEKSEAAWEKAGMPEAERVRLRDWMTRLMDEAEMKALDTLKEIPGTVGAIRRLAAKGYRLGVLTRSNHAYAEKALQMLGVRGLFQSVLGRGDTPQPKPYAEAMIYAAKDIGLPLSELVLIGDHHIDSTCAVNANCWFIGVATGGRGDRSWEVNRPAVILPSVADLPAYLESRG